MKYPDGVNLSAPETEELAALSAPLSLDAASTQDNSALATVLAQEASARYHIGPTVLALAASPIWRLMCADLVETSNDREQLRLAFLLASARLLLAGCELERDSE